MGDMNSSNSRITRTWRNFTKHDHVPQMEHDGHVSSSYWWWRIFFFKSCGPPAGKKKKFPTPIGV